MGSPRTNEQQLIDIMFEVAIKSAAAFHGMPNETIAAWVADQLRQCGFPTQPVGISWGVLTEEFYTKSRTR